MFRLLLGLYRPQAGAITIGGVDASAITDAERRGCIGCVEQHFSPVPGTVLDQITLGDERISRAMAERAARLAGLDEITANLDAETEARVLKALRRASEGRTVLSISHRIYESLGGRTIEIKPLNSRIRGEQPTASFQKKQSDRL